MDKNVLFVQMIKGHLEGMTKDERLAYLGKLLWGSRYGWGNEIIGGADCSGSVCWGLWLMGYKIRVAADWMLSNLTIPMKQLTPKSGNLVFWVRDNKAFHVAICEHDCIVMDAGRQFKGIPAHIVHDGFPGAAMDFRQLAWDKVEEVSEAGNRAYGVDAALRPLLGLFEIKERENEIPR